MSRILKRPMFRKGGSTGQGIMSGLVDRKNYKKDGLVTTAGQKASELVPELEQILRDFTPKTRLPLGEVGLALASGVDPLTAIGAGYKKFTKADDAREAAIRGGAAKLGIAQALKTPKDSRTAAVKNAMALGLIPGTKEFNDYVTAATIKGGLNIEFNPDGSVKSISEGPKKSTPNVEKAQELKTTTFQMNNAGQNLIKNLQDSKVGPVGSFITALDSAGSQIKQAADSLGFNTTGPNKTYDEQGDAVDKYIRDKFGSQIGDDATKFAKIKSVSINLAYLMARIDEPGGRFTDRDIALKMEELGIGANPQRTIDVLTNSLQLRNQNSAFAYSQLTGKPLDFSGIPVVGQVPKIGTVPESKGVKEKTEDNDPYKIR